ncbi:MAG: hypothetical protein Fur0024_5570 [Patescibacteria group bacterium]
MAEDIVTQITIENLEKYGSVAFALSGVSLQVFVTYLEYAQGFPKVGKIGSEIPASILFSILSLIVTIPLCLEYLKSISIQSVPQEV